MTIDELKTKLLLIKEKYGHDIEAAHSYADSALLEYIDDKEVEEIWDSIEKWYS